MLRRVRTNILLASPPASPLLQHLPTRDSHHHLLNYAAGSQLALEFGHSCDQGKISRLSQGQVSGTSLRVPVIPARTL